MTERKELDEATLRAYLDNALSPQAREAVEQLLAQSGQAQAKLEQLRRENNPNRPYPGSISPNPQRTFTGRAGSETAANPPGGRLTA